jgi:rhodanese-related sulfurtransferase
MLIRVSRSSIPRTARSIRALPKSASCFQPAITKTSQLRFYSQPERLSKFYTFAEVHLTSTSSKTSPPDPSQIQSLTKNPSPNTVLIDTREPSELQSTGTIPGSLNIPVTSKPDAFFITPEEFEDRFGFERPAKDKEVVFYCKAGVRSRAAATLARQAGWENVSEYSGSWLDWEKNGGEKESVR